MQSEEEFQAWLAEVQAERRRTREERGVRGMTLEELAELPALFESDEEVAAFNRAVREWRRQDLVGPD
jgi:hypothetical protein